MPTTATRLINLILLLQRKPNQKAADLARELDVSVRTLHRYFEMLDEIGIPVYSERGPYGGFSLVRGYRMPPLVFTPEEAVTVCLGVSLVEQMWGQLYRQAARGAQAKLENLLPDEQRHEVAWAQRALFATGMHRADLTVLEPQLEKLRRAAREHRQVEMIYQSRGQTEAVPRRFDPYALVHRWGWWYAIGYCHLRQEVRTFRVDRIAGLTLLDEIFDLPAEFDLHAYLADEQQPAPQYRAQLRFAPQAAQTALENRLFWESLEEQIDGSVLVILASPDLDWAASSVLMYGPLVEVIHPPELRRKVAEWAQAVASIYTQERKK
jgi:predicted DNA-binding transcriptional regulator YafY